jgi:hypothetical protein
MTCRSKNVSPKIKSNDPMKMSNHQQLYIPNWYKGKVGTSPPIIITLKDAPTLFGNTIVVIYGVETRGLSPSKDARC